MNKTKEIKKDRESFMLDENEAKRFKEITQKGFWRDRYYMVTEKHFVKTGLNNNEECLRILIDIALNDNARLVRQEAVRTCNVLGLTYKGEPITLRKMPSLYQITHVKEKRMKEIIFLSCVKAGIPMYPRDRKLSNDELMTISKKFSELYPLLFDKIDGRTTQNTKGIISKKKNKAIYNLISNYYSKISQDRIERYYKHHRDCRADDAN